MEDGMICPAEITADRDIAPVISVNAPYDIDAVQYLRRYNILRSSNSFTLITAAVSLTAAIASAALGFYLITIAAGLILLMTLFVIYQIKPSAKRIYKRLYEGETLRRFSFYDDHFTMESKRGALYIKYDTLKNVVLSDRYILIYLPSGTGYIISGDKHDEIVMFMKNKVKNIKEIH